MTDLTAEEISRLVGHLEHDLATSLSDEERAKLIERLEDDLLIRAPTGRRFMAGADQALKKWADEYRRGDWRLIQRLTGALRRGPSKPAPLLLESDESERVQSVIFRMTDYNRMMIFAHYVHRPKVVADFYAANQKGESESQSDYNSRIQAMYYKKLDYPVSTYKRDLKDAKYEFVVRGGL